MATGKQIKQDALKIFESMNLYRGNTPFPRMIEESWEFAKLLNCFADQYDQAQCKPAGPPIESPQNKGGLVKK